MEIHPLPEHPYQILQQLTEHIKVRTCLVQLCARMAMLQKLPAACVLTACPCLTSWPQYPVQSVRHGAINECLCLCLSKLLRAASYRPSSLLNCCSAAAAQLCEVQ